MNFLPEMPDYFIGCDPDTRHSAYAIVDLDGKVCSAWTVESNGSEADQSHQHSAKARKLSLPPNTIAVVEGQQVYQDDKKSNPADLIKLARSSGISCAYLAQSCSDIQIVLPSEWKGTRQKHAHQADILTRIGQNPIIKGKGDHRYAVPADDFLNLNLTQYKHVVDAIGLALWLRDSYVWEFKKRNKLKN